MSQHRRVHWTQRLSYRFVPIEQSAPHRAPKAASAAEKRQAMGRDPLTRAGNGA